MANHPLPLQSGVDLDFLKEPEPFVTCFRVTRWPVQIIFSFTPIPAKMIQFETSICFNWVQKGWGGFNHQVGDVIFERNVRFSEGQVNLSCILIQIHGMWAVAKKNASGWEKLPSGGPISSETCLSPKKNGPTKRVLRLFYWVVVSNIFYVHP